MEPVKVFIAPIERVNIQPRKIGRPKTLTEEERAERKTERSRKYRQQNAAKIALYNAERRQLARNKKEVVYVELIV
jgi:hypothetical protein